MAKHVYYFEVPRSSAEFINTQGELRLYGAATHYRNYADAWVDTTHAQRSLSELGVGPDLNQQVYVPDLSIIYGEQVSNLYMWAKNSPPSGTWEIQPQNIVSATVHFGYNPLYSGTYRDCPLDEQGKINFIPALAEAHRRHAALQALADAVDKSSEACRRMFDLTSVKDHMRLHDIYAHDGAWRLHQQDLMSNLTESLSVKLTSKLSLEFSMHLLEFQNHAHLAYMNYGMEVSEKPTSVEKRCIDSLCSALNWLENTVKAEGMCTSPEVWDEFRQIKQELADLSHKVSVEAPTMPSVYLVEHRNLGKTVNHCTNAQEMMPAFGSWSEMHQYIQQQTVRMEKEDPTSTGYFMIYRGNAPSVKPMMSKSDVALSSTEVYMLGNGIFRTTTYTVPAAITEQEKRLGTWDAIKEFAQEHDLDPTSLFEYPVEKCEQIRKAFEPGGILESGYTLESITADKPELAPLRNIQKLLCGEHATFDTVRAAMLIEENYLKNAQEKLGAGMSVREFVRTEGWFALKDAEHYTQFEPSMPHNDELYKIFYACLEAGRTDPDKDALEMLEWYADGCLEEYEHEDVE